MNKPIPSDDGGIDPRLFVSSVQKAMLVMEAFTREDRAMSIARISDKTGMGRSAAQRFVYTLEKIGYIQRNPDTREYRLSNRSFRFVQSILSSNTTLDASFHLLTRLAEQIEETVSWVELSDQEIVVIANVPSPNVSAVNLPVGSRFLALTASSGLMYLADMPPETVRQYFDAADEAAHARLGGVDFEGYLARLAHAREAGYAMTEKDVDFSSLSVSAPVRDYRGKVIAAINISILRARMQPDEVRARVVPLLLDAARIAGNAAIG
ncbi:IclR family transcriptional regulator [Limoniibacter endophyticus]|uniref:IclR family transcriptional regulator n=1 Tax=Limoniibacter endophyticus TaxID=1565040 RepID=A0A8J3DL80_9HYPH|nr:IclR family transcriptional regulator [Limoniibacter endophyticus]GHC78873.1 IclR family transcriptional regulator [Limoniibacter endophyticus]